MQLNTKKKKNPIKKWAEDLNKHFSKGNTDGQQTHRKRLDLTNYQRKATQNRSE